MINADDFSTVSLARLTAAANWQEKYRLITDWGKLITVKPAIREDKHLIKGCETSVWFAHQLITDKHHFQFDSESRVINGLAAVLLSIVNNKTTEELWQIEVQNLLQAAGLEKHMTPSRNNGFKRIVETVYLWANINR